MSVSIRIVSAGCFLLISSLLSFSAALAQPDFWYDGRRKVPLVTEAQSDGSQGPTQYQSSRSVHRDVARRNDGRLYVCYPPTWSDGQIASLEQRYQLLPTQQPLPDDARVRLYQHAKIFDTTSLANRIFEENDLDCAAPLWQKRVSLKTVVPNDPLFSQQWYLENFGQCGAGAGEDISASAAWELSLGEDITLAIVDSGIDLQHPDLVGNLLFGGHRDFIPDGSAIGPHGTAVAGLAAAKGFNNRGLIGVAPETSMLSFRIISGEELFADEADEAAALNSWRVDVDIYNNSWGPPDDDLASFEGPSMLVRDAIESGVRQGRGGLGSIYLWAAGNGGPTQSSTLDGYANLRHAISVTATTCTGRAASYAELGSNILVNAPAGDGAFGLVTTDEVGSFGYNAGLGFGDLSDPDYTDTFIGTSAATPVVSGVVALMLEANPQLNWREVQQILALSAEQNHPSQQYWQRNGAGFWVNEDYGFGRVNAEQAVKMALSWSEPVATESSVRYERTVNRLIPDDSVPGLVDTIEVNEALRVETVMVTIDAPDHTYWGDLSLYLTSPQGTRVQLVQSQFLSTFALLLGYNQWAIKDVLHLGELSQGLWTLEIYDEGTGDTGTLSSWELEIFGTTVPESPQQLPVACAAVPVSNPASTSAASLSLGVNVHGGNYQKTASGSVQEDFGLVASVQGTDNVGEQLLVALYEHPVAGGGWFSLTDNGWSSWNGEVASLHGFSPTPGQVRQIHAGKLAAGDFSFWSGFRDQQGNLFYCPAPAVISVQ